MTQSLNLVPNQTTNGQGNQVPQRSAPQELRESDGGSIRQQAAKRLKDYDRANEKELEGLSVRVKIDRGGDGTNVFTDSLAQRYLLSGTVKIYGPFRVTR